MKTNSLTLLLLVFAAACRSDGSDHGSKTEIESRQIKKLGLNESSVISYPDDYTFAEDSTFSLLSWNVEHFVDPFDDPYINHPREDSPRAEMTEKISLFVEAIKKADADVVVLQEFESEKYLMQLASDSFPELNYRFFADAASPNWYMNVVLMSRFPLGVMHAYGDVYTPLIDYENEKGIKERQAKINTRMWKMQVFPSTNYQFWLCGVHLKAGRGERNEATRLGQIALLKDQFNTLLRQDGAANLMIAGDFNALPDGPELDELCRPAKGAVSFIDHLNPTDYTHPADKPERRLDYILMNSQMQAEMIKNSLKVRSFFSADSMRIISDHLPLTIQFRTSDL